MTIQLLLTLVQIVFIGILIYIQLPLIKTLKEINRSQELPFNMAMKQVENIDQILKIKEKKFNQIIEDLKNDYENKIREFQISESDKDKSIEIYRKNIEAIEIATNWEVGRTLKNVISDFQISLLVLIEEIINKSKDEKERIIEKIKNSSKRDVFKGATEAALRIYKDLSDSIMLKHSPVMPYNTYKDSYNNS